MNIGLVGICALYWPHAMARGLAAIRGARLAAFATLGTPDRTIKDHLGMTSGQYAGKYNIKKYISVEDMLKGEKLDALILCTRHTEHAAWVKRLAGYGKPLYVLKTFATSMADANRMVRLARKHRLTIATGPSGRFLAPIAAAKKAVDAGKIGKPFSMRLMHHHGVIDGFGKKDWYRDKKEGGPEFSLGWYVLDLVLYFLGRGVNRITADYGNFTSPGSPFMDCGKLLVGFKNGTQASVDMYFCNRAGYPSWEMEVVGTNGVVSVKQQGDDPGKVQVKLFNRKGCTILPVPARAVNWELFWVHDLMKNRKPALDAEYGALLTRLSLAARKSAAEKRTVRV